MNATILAWTVSKSGMEGTVLLGSGVWICIAVTVLCAFQDDVRGPQKVCAPLDARCSLKGLCGGPSQSAKILSFHVRLKVSFALSCGGNRQLCFRHVGQKYRIDCGRELLHCEL